MLKHWMPTLWEGSKRWSLTCSASQSFSIGDLCPLSHFWTFWPFFPQPLTQTPCVIWSRSTVFEHWTLAEEADNIDLTPRLGQTINFVPVNKNQNLQQQFDLCVPLITSDQSLRLQGSLYTYHNVARMLSHTSYHAPKAILKEHRYALKVALWLVWMWRKEKVCSSVCTPKWF